MHWSSKKILMGKKILRFNLDDDKRKYLMPIFQNEEL